MASKATISNFTCSSSGLCTWSNPGRPSAPLILSVGSFSVVLSPTATSYQIPAAQLTPKEKVSLERVNISVQNIFTTSIPAAMPPVNVSPPVMS